jgi:hypothetical protein
MDGYGEVAHLDSNMRVEHPGIRIITVSVFDVVDNDLRSEIETLHVGTRPTNYATNTNLFGPEVSFGTKIMDYYPGEQIILVKFAVGGSNLHTEWSPGTPVSSTDTVPDMGTYFRHWSQFVGEIFQMILDGGETPIFSGFLWMQGETDSMDEIHANNYKAHLIRLISGVRMRLSELEASEGDLQLTNAYSMPFVIGEIAPVAQYWTYFSTINTAQKEVANQLLYTWSFSTEDLEMGPDAVHYSAVGQLSLGELFAARFRDPPENEQMEESVHEMRVEELQEAPFPTADGEMLKLERSGDGTTEEFFSIPDEYESLFEIPLLESGIQEVASLEASLQNRLTDHPIENFAYLMMTNTEHTANTRNWVWVEIEPFTMSAEDAGLPLTRAFKQPIKITNWQKHDADCNDPETTPCEQEGHMEFWPFQYATGIDGFYDHEDVIDDSGPYGSMQLHAENGDTIFAYNGWAHPGANELGIGPDSSSNPDWTLSGNARSYTERKLWVYAKF